MMKPLARSSLVRHALLFTAVRVVAHLAAIFTPLGHADDRGYVLCFTDPNPCPTCDETMGAYQCPVNLNGWKWGYCDLGAAYSKT